MAKLRSSVRLVCKPSVFKRFKICRWTCPTGKLRGVEFVDRIDPRFTAIVHPSTKKAGNYQVSFFDDRGPSGDIQGSTCDGVLRELEPARWRLRSVDLSGPRRRRS